MKDLTFTIKNKFLTALSCSIIAFLLFATTDIYGQASQLTPIGSTIGATNSDDSYSQVDLTSVFPYGINFGGTNYDNMYIGTNGYVTFGSGYSSYHPEGIAGWDAGYPIIAAQYDDLDPGDGGDIYYNQNTTYDYIVATYVNVEPYSSPPEWGTGSDGTSFQIILRKPSDYSSSNKNFTIEVRYNDIGWHHSGNISSEATAGWSTGDQTTYAEMPYSGTSDFHLNESNSNIGQTGIYQWDVEGGTVQSAPTVNETDAITSITSISAESGGNVSSDGGASVTERGTVWSTSSPPFYSDNYSDDGGSGTGSFNSSISGLSPNTTYYVRAYAINSEGTGYGPERSFTTDRKELTIDGSFTANNKTYDGMVSSTMASNNLSLSGIVGSDDVSLSNVVVEFATADKGTGITVSVASASLSGTDAEDYTLSLSGSPTTTADITAKELTVSGAAADNKVYDATTDATISGATLEGVVSGDDVTLDNATSGTFSQAEVGTGIGVSTSMSVTGTDASNYNLTQPGGLSADITAKELTVSGASASDKIYDATTNAAISDATLEGVVSGDEVTLDNATSGTFAQADIGTGIAVSNSMSISGTDANNYNFTQPSGLSADITVKELTVSGASAADKVYNATTDATISDATLEGVVSGDEVTLENATSGTFSQADIGTGIAVSTSMTINGTDAANYSLTQPGGLSADITAKELTVSGATASDKVYDATTDAAISDATLEGVVSSDEVTLDNATSGTFSQAEVGTGIGVSTSMSVTGTDASNYNLTQPGGLSADITAKELTVSGATASDKIYDATTDAAISDATLEGVVSGDEVTLENASSGTFAQVDIGADIGVSTSMSVNGTDATNYSLTQPGGLSADITAKELTVSGATASDKVYDATTDAAISDATLEGVVSSDEVTLDNATSGTFSQAEVGTGIGVSTSMSVTGTDASNYNLTQPGGLSADITAKELTVSGATASDKIYDATTDAAISDATLEGVVSGDEVTLDNATSGTFAQADIGTGIAVSNSMSISGTDANNYNFTQPSGLSADITAKELTVSGATAADKVYDATADATISGATLEGVVSGDDVTLDNATSGTFAQTDIGTGIAVSNSMSINGTDAANYNLTQPSGLSADITKKELTVSRASASDKVYDATADAKVSGARLEGAISGDDVSLVNTTSGTFAQADVGTDIDVSTSMDVRGTDTDNYSLTQPGRLSADIKAKELTVTADDQTREEGTPNPEFTISYNGFVKSENVDVFSSKPTASCTASEASKVGEYDITVSGGTAHNYNLTYISGTLTITEDITNPLLSVTNTEAILKITNHGNQKAETSINAADVIENASDNCGIVDTTLSKSTFSIYDKGLNTIDVTVKDENGNSTTKTAEVNVVYQPTGINDLTDKDITIHPNPVSNKLHLESIDQSNKEITLFNSIGKIVLQSEMKKEETIDVSGLNDGIYLLQVRANGNTITKKVIKQ